MRKLTEPLEVRVWEWHRVRLKHKARTVTQAIHGVLQQRVDYAPHTAGISYRCPWGHKASYSSSQKVGSS